MTTVLTGPGSANPIAGQFLALKTDGRWVDEMVLKAPAAMKFALGENPKSVYNDRKETPVTRMATAALIREHLAKAQEYQDKQAKADGDPDQDMPDYDAKLEALVPVVAGELPAHFHAHRADDIATGVRINPVQHPAKFRAAAHHFTYRCSHYGLGPDDGSLIEWRRHSRVKTGHDVWIGHNAVVMGGVTVGDGAVIGAGAVVTHDVAPYEIVGGVPARHIGWRYEEDIIAALRRIRWWDWSHGELKQRLRDFDDAAAFCRKFDPQ